MPRSPLLTLDEVAEVLNVSWTQAYRLVTSRDLPAVQIGGRRQWRVDPALLQEWLDGKHVQTAASTPVTRASVVACDEADSN
ncbi:MAG: helix-turn-helix domain-containing protein [Mycobacteriales bacterium]